MGTICRGRTTGVKEKTMAFVVREKVRLYWRADGDEGKPPLLLLNSLGTDHAMWDAVMPRLMRFIRRFLRSPSPAPAAV